MLKRIISWFKRWKRPVVVISSLLIIGLGILWISNATQQNGNGTVVTQKDGGEVKPPEAEKGAEVAPQKAEVATTNPPTGQKSESSTTKTVWSSILSWFLAAVLIIVAVTLPFLLFYITKQSKKIKEGWGQYVPWAAITGLVALNLIAWAVIPEIWIPWWKNWRLFWSSNVGLVAVSTFLKFDQKLVAKAILTLIIIGNLTVWLQSETVDGWIDDFNEWKERSEKSSLPKPAVVSIDSGAKSYDILVGRNTWSLVNVNGRRYSADPHGPVLVRINGGEPFKYSAGEPRVSVKGRTNTIEFKSDTDSDIVVNIKFY